MYLSLDGTCSVHMSQLYGGVWLGFPVCIVATNVVHCGPLQLLTELLIQLQSIIYMHN